MKGIARHGDLPNGSVTVHKFGGTSVGGADQFLKVVDIIKQVVPVERPTVVVSAMSGVTTLLYSAIAAANARTSYDPILAKIQAIHDECLHAVGLPESEVMRFKALIAADLTGIAKHLAVIVASSAGHNCSDLISDVIAAYGEIWSSQILSALLTAAGIPSCWINARDFLFLSPLSGKDARVDWKRSHAPHVDPSVVVPVITGFLATSAAGLPTTLKRNGSDHSGAIVANLVNAAMLTIWTDVDGIFSADPRVVKQARMVPCMSYKETAELAYFGAKVIHPQTMAPCVGKKIPVVLRNTFNTDCAGTLISASPDGEARAVTIIPEIALLNIEGSGLFGFSGIAAKLFSAVAAADTNVIMITQASSEYSICFAIPVADARVCEDAVKLAFDREIEEGSLDVSVDAGVAIVAAVGEGMHKQIGLLGKLATALGEASVNILAVAQGSSERNVTFAVSSAHGTNAVLALHQALVE